MKRTLHIFLWLVLISIIGIKGHAQYILSFDDFPFTSKKHPISEKVKLNSTQEVESYLSASLPYLKEKKVELKRIQVISSITSTFYYYTLIYQNVPIYKSSIKVQVLKSGELLSISESVPSSFQFVNTAPVLKSQTKGTPVWFALKDGLHAAFLKQKDEGDIHAEYIESLEGEMLFYNDLNVYNSDSLANVAVFNPDPLTSAQRTYGTPYVDNNDNDLLALNNERLFTQIPVTYNGTIFSLENDYVKVVEFSAPSIAPVTSNNGNFIYTRSQSGFEDVNAYYHITQYQNYIQSLGIDNLPGMQIHIDTHGNNGADNSFFSPSASPPRITFGQGGVDDAEDADVVVHEYGHAISFGAAPGTNAGTERQAIDEALGDYMASSYSKDINPYLWENVFSWDGHNPFWTGRTTVSNKKYPTDLQNDLYKDAEIWSSTLMQISQDIGRGVLDRILFESLYAYYQGMKMPDAAQFLLQADSLLYNYEHRDAICLRVTDRGIYQCPTASYLDSIDEIKNMILLRKSQDFSNGKTCSVTYHGYKHLSLDIYDAEGRLIKSESYRPGNTIEIDAALFSAGLYFVRTYLNYEYANSFKILKY